MVGGCVAALTLLTTLGPYPVSMVGLPGETSNMTPPTVCLLVLAVGQLAAALLLRPRLSSALERPRAWAAVVRFGAMAMTTYLWHLSVLVLAYVGLISAGVTPPAAGTGLWWATRPFWLLGLAAVTSALATVLAPLERGRAPRRPAPAPVGGAAGPAPGIPGPAWPTVVAGLGGGLASFGLLGYVASGLAPAAFASSVLLFVPVDPVTNTVCVVLGLALTTLASRERRPVT